MTKKYDVVIIGSGIGGMATAGLVSRDKKVLVIEKNKVYGGYCSGFSRNGFKFESAIQAINGLYSNNTVYEALKESEGAKSLETVTPKDLYRAIFPEHDIVVPQKNVDKYKNILVSLFPKEKNGIGGLFNTMSLIFREMYRFHMCNSFKKSPYILKYNKKSLKQLLDEFIKNAKLKAIISQYWIYRGLPPSKLSAVTFAFIWHDYTANGSYYPKYGMDGMIEDISKNIRNNGGEILSNKEVSKICVKNGKVDYIEIQGGEKIKADVYVSNIDVFKTFQMIESEDDSKIKSLLFKLQQRSASISGFKIYLGLSIDIKKIGIPEYEIFVSPSYDVEKMYKAALENCLEKTAYSITIYSNLVNSICAKNESVISMGALSGYDFWERFTPAEYKKQKETIAENIIINAERIIPNLRKYITTKVIATPLTMERYTGNKKGSIYGWNKKSPSIHDIIYINPTTPIKNLMLASHWTKMGGGVGGTILSAQRVYELIKKGYGI